MADSVSVRTVEIYESPVDGKWLHDNQYNLQIAKAVCKSEGEPICNIIWKSRQVAPNTVISWEPVYALNWTAQIPARGVSVTLFGNWQQCNKGQVFNIDKFGVFQRGDRDKADPGFMTVGNIDYSNPDTDGIHIVIGIKNSEGGFDTIFCDRTAVAKNSSAKYQPREEVQLWYEAGVRTCTMFSEINTAVLKVDLTNPVNNTGQYYWWATFAKTGDWTDSDVRPQNPQGSPIACKDFTAAV